MRLQKLLQRLQAHRATVVSRQTRAATRDFLFPDLGITRLEERRLLNAAPVVMPDSKAAVENQTLTVDAPDGVLANDTDADGDTLTAFLNNGPTYGLVTLHPDGSFDYQPNTGFNGADSFTYHANDGQADSNVTTVTLNVSGVNDPPVNHIPNASYTTPEDTAKPITLITVTDPDSGATPIITSFQVQNGTLSVAIHPGDTDLGGGNFALANGGHLFGNGTGFLQILGSQVQINDTLSGPVGLTYKPNPNFNGSDSLQMVTHDNGATGAGGPMSDSDMSTIHVTAVNDAPVNTLPGSFTTTEDPATPLVLSGISVSDVDSDPSPISTSFQVNNGVLS
ncbi:MAG TPA: Ig-like domain-containing protein, partial [Pirellulales bacterium]